MVNSFAPNFCAGAARPSAVRSLRFPITADEPVRGAYGVPAYIRRARNLEAAEQELEGRLLRLWFERVRHSAHEMKSFLSIFAGQRDLWEFFDKGHLYTACKETAALVSRHPDYPRMLVNTGVFSSGRRTRFRRLCAAVREFNEGWPAAALTVDLEPINAMIDGYNRWFPLERECAMRYAFHALDDFRPLPFLDPADLPFRQPLLPMLE